MNTPCIVHSRLVTRVTALAVLGLLLPLVITAASAVAATDQPASRQAADKAAKLPVTSSFKKETDGENKGLYILTLKNISPIALKVTATVHESVISHNRPKTRTLPPQVIEPGQRWRIEALAAHDKVTLVAEGFETLELITP